MSELEKLRVFSGDGKLYDRLRQPEDPIRIGSILYRIIEKLPIEDEIVLTDTNDNE